MEDIRDVDVGRYKVPMWRNAIAHQVLVEESAEWTARLKAAQAAGRYKGKTKVGPERIIFNMCFRPSMFTRLQAAKMRDRYKQLLKEKRDAKKYLDGIKR